MVLQALSLFLILFSSTVYANYFVCIEPSNADLINCEATKVNELDKYCTKKYSNKFKSFIKSNSCSERLAYGFRGEKYEKKEEEAIKSPCYVRRDGEQRGCKVWKYSPALNFCSHVFGPKYLPFQPGENCNYEDSLAEAEMKASSTLIAGLKDKFEKVDSIISLIDRKGDLSDFRQRSSFRPIKNFDFYSYEMQYALTELKNLKNILQDRSFYKVALIGNDPDIIEFVYYLKKYIQLVGRVHELYAFHAHSNSDHLKTYSFKKLKQFNLRINKIFAFEVLSQVSVNASTIDEETVELSFTEATKQLFEYNSLAEPLNENQYAKLVKFMGLRENLINYWAIQRSGLADSEALSSNQCSDFLSLRTENERSLINIESNNFDIYYNGFGKAMDELLENIEFPLVGDLVFDKIENRLKNELKKLDFSQEKIRELLVEDRDLLLEAEKESHELLLILQLKASVLNGDDLKDKKLITERILSSLKVYKKESIKNTIIDFYNFLGEGFLEQLSIVIESEFENNTYQKIEEDLKEPLYKYLQERLSESKIKEDNLNELIKKNVELAKKYAQDAYAKNNIAHSRVLKVFPRSFKELSPVLLNKLGDKFSDITSTIKHNEPLRNIFTHITDELSNFKASEPDDFKKTESEFKKYLIEKLEELADQEIVSIIMEKPVPNEQKLRDPKEKLNPYQTLVYEDGTPIVLHINQVYKSLLKPFVSDIPFQNLEMRMSPLWGGYRVKESLEQIEDKTSIDFYIGLREPTKKEIFELYHRSIDTAKYYLAKNIEAKKNKDIEKDRETVSEFGDNYFKRGYRFVVDLFSSLSYERAKKNVIQNAKNNQNNYELEETITSKSYFLYRVFNLFSVVGPLTSYMGDENNIIYSNKDIRLLLNNRLEEVYSISPLLKIRLSENIPAMTYVQLPYAYGGGFYQKVSTKKKFSLLRQISRHAYDPDLNIISTKKATELIKKTLNHSKKNFTEVFEKFCLANIENYENDEHFKQAFNSSLNLRHSLKSNVGTTEYNARNIKLLDEKVRKGIRGTLTAINEDYIEPNLLIIGAATLVALLLVGTVFTAGSLGLTIPGALSIAGTISATALTSLKVNIILFAIFATSTTARLNTSLIVVPKQMDFNQKVIQSQLSEGEILNYSALAEIKEKNDELRNMTLLFAPLDILFGKSVASQIASRLGISGVKSFYRLTGVKLNKYKGFSYRGVVQPKKDGMRMDILDRMANKVSNTKRKIELMLPKYQDLPQGYFGITALKYGLLKKVKENKSLTLYELMESIEVYSQDFFKRFKNYTNLSSTNQKMMDELVLTGGLKFKEVFEYGLKNTSFILRIKSEVEALKAGTFLELRNEYGVLLSKIKKLQGEALKERFETLTGLKSLLSQMQKDLNSGVHESKVLEEFIQRLNHNELNLLEKIVKTGNSNVKQLKTVFKDFREVNQNLVSTSYLYGDLLGKSFYEINPYNSLIHSETYNYRFASPYEDLRAYYEAIAKQLSRGNLDDETKLLQESIEIELGLLSRMNEAN